MSEKPAYFLVHVLGTGGFEYYTGKTRGTAWGRVPCFTERKYGAHLYQSLNIAMKKRGEFRAAGYQCEVVDANTLLAVERVEDRGRK